MKSFSIQSQPDDETCGPTCLHAVYRHFDLSLSLEEVIKSVKFLENGGTLAVFLGIDALRRGFKVKIISYNLMVFDPSWEGLESGQLIEKLKKMLLVRKNNKLRTAIKAYIKFLELGGKISFEMLNMNLLNKYFKKNLPVLTGVSATYLYESKREYAIGNKTYYDDIKGEPTGHFVVLLGTDEDGNVKVADPYTDNRFRKRYYSIGKQRLLNSILLGLVTYDANLLIINR